MPDIRYPYHLVPFSISFDSIKRESTPSSIAISVIFFTSDDNTFGKGFDWETAPWYSAEGLQDIADLHDKVIADGNLYTVESLQK